TQVDTALREDIGSGDVTAALVPAGQRVRGSVVTREAAILCGRAWAEETFRRLDPQVRLSWHAADGERLGANQVICEIEGPARAAALRNSPWKWKSNPRPSSRRPSAPTRTSSCWMTSAWPVCRPR